MTVKEWIKQPMPPLQLKLDQVRWCGKCGELTAQRLSKSLWGWARVCETCGKVEWVKEKTRP